MHEYYAKNRAKFKKTMNRYLVLISKEMEQLTGKPYAELFESIWTFYEENLLEKFPYIGGDEASGTGNLTGAYYFIAMGEVLKEYHISVEKSGYLMVLSYQRTTQKLPGIAKSMMQFLIKHPSLLRKLFQKKDRKNARIAAKYPGSFETETLVSPKEGAVFTYHTLVCPLSDFARKYGYEEYMPYICNLDYVMFGELDVPLYRTHTCFSDGDYCDFSVRPEDKILDSWPPVFQQGKGCK
ncbi:MAG: L-2-amino-thiazoline-4-carboxylic acid hydrolase [Eubacteriales bacterium]|nr:L-2-amino-thiazoline-4-carboxylic acid hydrolase [Eubacteriales bacterium]